MAAIKLFGESGVSAVSLREINRAAGSKNNSALHYHFNNKLGLVTAVIDFIQTEFNQQRGTGLAALEIQANNAATKKLLSIEEIMRLVITPYVTIIEQYNWGFDAVRAVARMEFDGDIEVQEILNKSSQADAKILFRLLKILLPELSPKQIKQRLNYAVKSVIHGFADYKNLKHSYLGDLSIRKLSQLAEFHLSMTVAILRAP
jgi:AcrR family transcriptional regulator